MPRALSTLERRLEGDLARHHRAVPDLLGRPVRHQRHVVPVPHQAERERRARGAGAHDRDATGGAHASQRLTHGSRRARAVQAGGERVDHREVVDAGQLAVVEPVEPSRPGRGCSAPGRSSSGRRARPRRRRRDGSRIRVAGSAASYIPGTCSGVPPRKSTAAPEPMPLSTAARRLPDRRERDDPVDGVRLVGEPQHEVTAGGVPDERGRGGAYAGPVEQPGQRGERGVEVGRRVAAQAPGPAAVLHRRDHEPRRRPARSPAAGRASGRRPAARTRRARRPPAAAARASRPPAGVRRPGRRRAARSGAPRPGAPRRASSRRRVARRPPLATVRLVESRA